MEEIKLRQQQLGKSLDEAEKLVNQGATAKAKTMAQAVLAEDSGSSRARELLTRINQQSELRGTCTATASLAFAAIRAQNLESARELLGIARASGCPEAERIGKALAKAETPEAAPAQPKPEPNKSQTSAPPEARGRSKHALIELDKAMRLVTRATGRWDAKKRVYPALSGNDPTIQAAVARVLRAADQERTAKPRRSSSNRNQSHGGSHAENQSFVALTLVVALIVTGCATTKGAIRRRRWKMRRRGGWRRYRRRAYWGAIVTQQGAGGTHRSGRWSSAWRRALPGSDCREPPNEDCSPGRARFPQ